MLENENMRFRRFLKNNADSDEVDRYFLELHNQLFSEYDCKKCRNCCKLYDTKIEDTEISTIAEYLSLTTDTVKKDYLTETPTGYELAAPCTFLTESGDCKINECRPAECKDFPYTNKPERLESMLSVVSFAEVCPVVFEILERLKDICGFRR